MLTPKQQFRLNRKRRIRSRVQGTAARPRLTVHRSLKTVSAQVIDDASGRTLAAVSTREVKGKMTAETAKKAGALLAEKAKKAGINAVVFDRNAYKYHGRVQALAEGAREGGLKF